MSVLAPAPVGPVSWIQSGSEMTIAFVFPGQGSQAVGMGEAFLSAFPIARETLEEVDDALEQNLSRLIREGPEEDLRLTENAQPALMAISIAVLRVIAREADFDISGRVTHVAGHSLGEYSALAAAGTFALPDAARLLKTRGEAMQEAVPVGEGAMAALLGATLDQASEIANGCGRGPGLRYRQRQRARPGGAFPATRRRSSARWRWPGSAASGARSCSPFRRRFTAVCCSRRPRR